MGKFLVGLISVFVGLNPLNAQQLILKQPIEGFRGEGEIIAFSSSRILLRLNKDGQWPRQILWEITEGDNRVCAIIFNKVGWHFAPTTDSCELDWIRMEPNQYAHRLSVVESIHNPSQMVTNSVAQSLLLTRPLVVPSPAAEEVSVTISKDTVNTLKLVPETMREGGTRASPMLSDSNTSTHLQGDQNQIFTDPLNHTSPIVTGLDNESSDSSDLGFDVSNSSIDFSEDMFDDQLVEHAIEIANSPERLKAADRDKQDSTHTTDLNHSDSVELIPQTDQKSQSLDTTILDANNLPDYIFTVPDFQPRNRWFGRKRNMPLKAASYAEDTIHMTKNEIRSQMDSLSLMKPSEDTSAAAILKTNLDYKIDTTTYSRRAPFISVASFETLEYTQEVLNQFTCPGGCIIVRSEKGLYYRIGFYPDPKNIAVDLREIRKKYSDAWLIN
ncbi:MAG: hypothetical protein O2862_06680 [Bacteroidetes bacterium]|nr:hypothetical protein [Bacteroidota bacterium]